MAEAEDVLVDAARHATVFARRLWAQHHPSRPPDRLALADIAERLAILVQAVFGIRAPLRVAQDPAPPTLLTRVFRRDDLPRHAAAIPCTDGSSIWLPRDLPGAHALDEYRSMALLRATMAARGSADRLAAARAAGGADVYLLIETAAAHSQLEILLPGMQAVLRRFRAAQLARRPGPDAFPATRRPLEELARRIMQGDVPDARMTRAGWSPDHSLELAGALSREWSSSSSAGGTSAPSLFRDLWTGDLRLPAPRAAVRESGPGEEPDTQAAVRSAGLTRRPQVREAKEAEDDEKAGAWMIQSASPAETAEDPFGLQRPVDLDEEAAAGEYADAVSELEQARLVSTPQRAKEILISDDPPDAVTRRALELGETETSLHYPEWDHRLSAYRHPGARVRLMPAPEGPMAWVTRTLHAHRALCADIGRRFEMLRAQRQRLRKQLDGDEVDIDACVEARADLMAGLPAAQAVYQSTRLTRRDLAITLLADVSGSTDSWVSGSRRVIDVEREALLLVCIALQSLREPWSVLAFSGEGPDNVAVREIKRFDQSFDDGAARRIAALEPERYTRVGAALRHSTAQLVRRDAQHRLLLLLSDGKPNDNDEYDGRYGAEDMRQAVTEARLQGIYPFCLTIDRQAADYLPRVFGANHYALLSKPEALPAVLLEWIRRLICC